MRVLIQSLCDPFTKFCLWFNPRVSPGGHVKLSINTVTQNVEWSLAGNFKTSTIGQDGTFYADPSLAVTDSVRVIAMVDGHATTAYVNIVPRPTYTIPTTLIH